MGKLSQLFGFHKKSPSDTKTQAIPSLSTPITKCVEPWQGNLPCVFGPTDGCNNHNGAHQNIFFDPLLFPDENPSKIKPSGNRHDKNAATEALASGERPMELQSQLPRTLDSGCLATLPRIHKSVPFALSFYHVNAVTDQLRAGATPQLSRFCCSATTGSNPALSWNIIPVIAGPSLEEASFILAYEMAFTVEADLGSWNESTQHGRAIVKNMLIGSGYREFTPCRHMKLSFRSHRGEGKDHVRYAGVSFSRKMEGQAETKEEWRSENEEKEIEPSVCTKCYTDLYLRFQLKGNVVLVSIQVYKDLGQGMHPADGKWLAVARGVDLVRDSSDAGRMRQRVIEQFRDGADAIGVIDDGGDGVRDLENME